MRIPITLHTAQKKANDIAFLDCGATECFISQRFIDQHKLGVHLMENPQKLQNADGSPNTGGGLKYYTELEVITGDTPHLLCFYVADMGPDDLILGYLWFVATNAHPVRLKLAFCTTCAVHVLVIAQGPSFLRLLRAWLRQRGDSQDERNTTVTSREVETIQQNVPLLSRKAKWFGKRDLCRCH